MENTTTGAAVTGEVAGGHTGGKYFTSTRIAFIAMFATLAGVLYVLNFSLPFAFPSFLEFKFSDVPILIGSFTLGPGAGAIIVAVEILIKLVIKGTSTMFVVRACRNGGIRLQKAPHFQGRACGHGHRHARRGGNSRTVQLAGACSVLHTNVF